MTVPRKADTWRKSSYSAQQTNCVEVALDTRAARVRDTKSREAGNLEVPALAWRALREQL